MLNYQRVFAPRLTQASLLPTKDCGTCKDLGFVSLVWFALWTSGNEGCASRMKFTNSQRTPKLYLEVSWNGGTPSHHPFYFRIVHHKPSSYWVPPILGNLHILYWLVVWNIWFFHILGMSSSQLTKSIIFQRGRAQPPTRWYLRVTYSNLPNRWITYATWRQDFAESSDAQMTSRRRGETNPCGHC